MSLTLTLRKIGFDTFKINLLTIPQSVLHRITVIGLAYISEIYVSHHSNHGGPNTGSSLLDIHSHFHSYPNAHAIQDGWNSRNSNAIRTRIVSAALYNIPFTPFPRTSSHHNRGNQENKKMPPTLPSLLETTLILSDQFCASLSSPLHPSKSKPSDNKDKNPAPLPLLSTSATALKAQVTKLSLLAVNAPFTPSAVISVLSTVNESISPSLVTAALLTTPSEYTQAFHAEAKLLVKDALREFRSLAGHVKVISLGVGGDMWETVTVTEQQKAEVMASTGRVWKTCDQLVSFAEEGIVEFLARKAKQYLELVRDGIRELEEWNPEQEGGDEDAFWDDEESDELGNMEDENASHGKGAATDKSHDGDITASLQSEKSHILRLLNPIAQIYPAIISQRLEKKTSPSPSTSKDLAQQKQPPLSPPQISQLDRLIQHLRELPNLVDEAAGSLYDHDIDNAVVNMMKLRKCAIAAADIARSPLGTNGRSSVLAKEEGRGSGEKEDMQNTTSDDKFPKWVDTWTRVVEEIAKSRGEAVKG
ncbi:hypothetical protein GX48_05471 [Paracoccidioides brasiliensis]|nr:hypothetical protein GX48_05471 [Paracoccidioides brasiliensis]